MMKKFLFTVCIIMMSATFAFSQGEMPEVEFNYYLVRSGMEDSLLIGESYSGDAPATIKFHMSPKHTAGYDAVYKWEFRKDDESSDPFITRNDTLTTYTFIESGTFIIKGSYELKAYDPEHAPVEEYYDEQTFSVSIPTSILDFPNAFSPNNDNINDYYNAKKGAKSLIEFHAYIFNRWGQKLYEWTDPYTQSKGWDGKYNGKDVAQGVYFLYCEAKGADGRVYTFRQDVNLLRNYTEGGIIE